MDYLSEKISYKSFQTLKPAIVAILEQYLQSRITSKHTGRKRHFDLNLFLDAVYQLLDNGDKSVWLKKSNNEVAGSYKRYLRHLKASNAMNIIFDHSLENEPEAFKLFADCFIAKSIDGNEGVGPNPTDRARNGIKCGLLIDERGIIWRHIILPANKSENTALISLLAHPFKKNKAVFTDAGFRFKQDALSVYTERGLRIVTKPRQTTPKNGYPKNFVCTGCCKRNKCTNGKLCINSNKRIDINKVKMSHQLHSRDNKIIKMNRWKIEKVNGSIRRFRGVNLKTTKLISTYELIVQFGILLHNCYQIKNPLR